MRMKKSVPAFLLALMILCSLCGCGISSAEVLEVIAPEATPVPGADLEFEGREQDEPVLAEITYSDILNTMNPFFAETDGEQISVKLTQLSLLAEEGKRSPSEISRTVNEDGSASVTIRLRKDVLCSDGVELTARDLLFTYYILLDTEYDGPITVNTLPIRGLSSYWNGMDAGLYTKYMMAYGTVYCNGKYDSELQAALRSARQEALLKGVKEEKLDSDPTVRAAAAALDSYDTELAERIRDNLETFWRADARQIVDYTMEYYASSISSRTGFSMEQVESNEGLQVMFAMLDRSLGTLGEDGVFTSSSGSSWDLSETFPTCEDLFNEMYIAYDGKAEQYWAVEGYGRVSMLDAAQNAFVTEWAREDPEWSGEVKSVSGITMEDDYTVTVVLEYCDDTVLKTLCEIPVVPLHLYGDEAHFSPSDGYFGFSADSFQRLREKTDYIGGAGEYVYDKTDIRTFYFTPNTSYWLQEWDADQVIMAKK